MDTKDTAKRVRFSLPAKPKQSNKEPQTRSRSIKPAISKSLSLPLIETGEKSEARSHSERCTRFHGYSLDSALDTDPYRAYEHKTVGGIYAQPKSNRLRTVSLDSGTQNSEPSHIIRENIRKISTYLPPTNKKLDFPLTLSSSNIEFEGKDAKNNTSNKGLWITHKGSPLRVVIHYREPKPPPQEEKSKKSRDHNKMLPEIRSKDKKLPEIRSKKGHAKTRRRCVSFKGHAMLALRLQQEKQRRVKQDSNKSKKRLDPSDSKSLPRLDKHFIPVNMSNDY